MNWVCNLVILSAAKNLIDELGLWAFHQPIRRRIHSWQSLTAEEFKFHPLALPGRILYNRSILAPAADRSFNKGWHSVLFSPAIPINPRNCLISTVIQLRSPRSLIGQRG